MPVSVSVAAAGAILVLRDALGALVLRVRVAADGVRVKEADTGYGSINPAIGADAIAPLAMPAGVWARL